MMRRGGRHTQQVVDILCNSSWYVLQTLVSVAGFRFARRASGRNGAFLGFARATSEEKGVFFAVARCANLLRGSFLIVSRAANYHRGAFPTLCTSCKLSARGLFYSLHELQTLCEGAFLILGLKMKAQSLPFGKFPLCDERGV